MKDEEQKDENKEPELPKNDDSEVLEFEYNADGEEDLKKTVKKLREELKICKKEKEEYLTGWQKERADFANYKKEEEMRRASFSESVRERILTRFLSVMDSFQMAFANKDAWNKVDENWRKGVEYIHSQMNSVFEEYGVKEFGEDGDAFDPNLHHSVDSMKTDKKDLDHKIAQVIQKGYKLGERVLRPARVNVFEYEAGGGE